MFKAKVIILAALTAALSFSCATGSSVKEYGSQSSRNADIAMDGKARYVDIVAFNDFHATVNEDPLGKNVGMAKMATIVKRVRTLNPNTIFVSGGDNFQGSALSVVTHGKIVAEFFNSIGLAASAVGNHEFDWGDSYFEDWSRTGGFPFIAANIVDKRTGKLPSWAKPYVIVKVGGRKVAIVGIATRDTVNTVAAKNLVNYEFTEAGSAAHYWSTVIRATEKPDAIVVLSHIPTATDEINAKRADSATALDEISAICAHRDDYDAVITGHSHLYVNGTNNGVPVLQAGYNGRSFDRVRFEFRDDGRVKITSSIIDFYKDKAQIAEDSDVRGIIDRYNAQFGEQFLQKVTTLKTELQHDALLTPNVSPMGYWVCSLLRDHYKVDAVIMNGGGLRKPFLPGTITVQDFWDLMPFDNTAVIFETTGADLKKMIDHGIDSQDFMNGQFAGLVVSYNPSRPYGQKIVSMTLADGTPVEDGKTYKVMVNDFMFEGGDQYSMIKPAAQNAVNTYEPVRDVLIEEAAKSAEIAVPTVNVLVPVSK